MLRGTIRLNNDLDHIPHSLRDTPHYFQHILDDQVLLQALVTPLRNRTFRLTSPNTALLREPVDKSSVEPRTDYWLWDEVLQQVGAVRGPMSYFNGYGLHGGLRVRSSFGSFLRNMMSFAGGYAYEDRFCRMNFVAARAGQTRNYLRRISEADQDLFRLDISPKTGAVRNEARSRIVRVNPFGRKKIRTFTFTLAGHGFRQLFAPTPEGEIGGLWAAEVNTPNPAPATLQVTKTDEDGDGLHFTVFNASEDSVEVIIDVYATTYNVIENENISELNVESSILYGRQPLEKFPEWGSTSQPIKEELDRLREPLQVAKIRMPIVPEVLDSGAVTDTGNREDFLNYEPGELVLVRHAGRSFVMLIGRRGVRSRRGMELEWDCVEFPTGSRAYSGGMYIDSREYILGVSTFLTGADLSEYANLSYNAKDMRRNGMSFVRPDFNPFMYDSRFMRRRGGFILRSARRTA